MPPTQKTSSSERRLHMLRNRRPLFPLLASLALLLSLSIGAGPASADHGPQNNLQKAIQFTNPAVVLIQTRQGARVLLNDGRTGEHGDQNFAPNEAGLGSGFAVNPDGIIVTASHVVEPDRVEMRTYFANQLILPRFGLTNLNPYKQWDTALRRAGKPETAGLLRRCYRQVSCQFRFGGRTQWRVWTGSRLPTARSTTSSRRSS